MSEIELSSTTAIRAEPKEYKGKHAIDIRKFVRTDKYNGPTKSGIWIPVENWTEFIEMVNSIEVPAVA